MHMYVIQKNKNDYQTEWNRTENVFYYQIHVRD